MRFIKQLVTGGHHPVCWWIFWRYFLGDSHGIWMEKCGKHPCKLFFQGKKISEMGHVCDVWCLQCYPLTVLLHHPFRFGIWIMKKFLWSRLFGDVCTRSRCVEILKKACKFGETCFSATINMSTLNHPQLINIRVDIHTWHCQSFFGPDVEVRVKPVQTWHQNRTSCNMFHSFLAGHSLSPFVINTRRKAILYIPETDGLRVRLILDIWVLNKFGGWQIGKPGNNNQLLYIGGFNLSSQKRIENNKCVWTNDRKE